MYILCDPSTVHWQHISLHSTPRIYIFARAYQKLGAISKSLAKVAGQTTSNGTQRNRLLFRLPFGRIHHKKRDTGYYASTQPAARSQLHVTGRYTSMYLRKNCAVPFRGKIQLHQLCSRNTRLPSQWVATRSDWQTATPPPTVVLACDTRVQRNMDSFPVLRAGTFVSSVAGAVGALPSALSPPSQYKPFRVFISDVRGRYGNHFEHAVSMSEDAFHGLMGCFASPLTSRRTHNSQPSFPGTRKVMWGSDGGARRGGGGRKGEAAQCGRAGG